MKGCETLEQKSEQLSLMDLLRRIHEDLGDSRYEDARKRADARMFVEENRSGLVSAMIKATRMRKLNHAVYYAAVLLLGGQNLWYISRRVGIMACEDGIDDTVMKYVSLVHTNKQKQIRDILNAVVAINLRPNWWEVDYGRALMYGCFREKKVDLSEYNDEEELIEEMRRCIFLTRSVEQWTRSSVIIMKLMKDFGWTLSKLHKWLLSTAKTYAEEEWEHELIETFRRMTPDMTKFGDSNWHYNFRYMFCMGRNPHVTSYEQLEADVAKYSGVVEEIIKVAEEKLEAGEVVIPPWAFDGMHASKKSQYGWVDKRFPGSYSGFYNCLKMYDKYGRLDPRDQGVLDSCKVPEEGLVLGNEFLDKITL